MGDEPAGLDLRRGGSTQASEVDRAVAAAELLRVRDPSEWTSLARCGDRDGRRSYRETRLEPGDRGDIVGRALPFSDLPDPAGADVGTGTDGPATIRRSLPTSPRRAPPVSLADDAAEAWGNAAIPGFGIGRPVTEPAHRPGGRRLPLATPDEVARAHRTFVIAPETLVLRHGGDVPLLIAYGVPGAVVERGQSQLLLGLLGATSRSLGDGPRRQRRRRVRPVTPPELAALRGAVLVAPRSAASSC